MLPSPTADFREGDEFPLHADQMVAIADNLQRSLSSLHTRYALHVTHERAMHSKILRDSLKKESRAAADHTLALRADHNASVALLHSEHAGALEAAQAAHAVQLHQLEEQVGADVVKRARSCHMRYRFPLLLRPLRKAEILLRAHKNTTQNS